MTVTQAKGGIGQNATGTKPQMQMPIGQHLANQSPTLIGGFAVSQARLSEKIGDETIQIGSAALGHIQPAGQLMMINHW